jgi:hypothetical protein
VKIMLHLKKTILAGCALAALAVFSIDASAAGGKPDGAAAPGQAGIGLQTGGELRRGDEQLDSGEFADSYTFTGRRGERVAITLSSSDFDTYAILIPPSGRQQDNDDNGDGASTDSRIETALAEDGEYRVIVTSYRPGETGSYRLDISPSAGTPRQSAVGSNSRVFALFVGVSDYGGRLEDLANTDSDAENLARRMRRAGVLDPASVVLTNAEATRGGVEAAFRRIAAQAGPDDTFLFFFSGHGDRVESDGEHRDEADGQAETIELRDGALHDHELARMFGTVRARLAVVALDSCFSGGFAEIAARPGVMGLFSSEEDLTSQVAENYSAGGYLAHFLQAGVGGEADLDGDRMLTAGELAAFLRRSFREEGDIPASTNDGLSDFQNLVVARGGVNVDDVIFRLGRS